ncbi:MAG: CinA family protein [Chloroflexota bacterium]|mgnify:CR=1 FL=1|nr:CinA family protein [Chloroflexota bacterium]
MTDEIDPLDPYTLELRVGAALRARGWILCAAESCTGGLILSRLTDIPGSSAYIAGGVVAYSYEAKQMLLGVRAKTLARFGAVSHQTADEMARGALTRFDADIAISVTGIAGPDGGMPDKPVGLVYIGVAARDGIIADEVLVQRYLWDGDRLANKRASVDAALRLVLAICGGGA